MVAPSSPFVGRSRELEALSALSGSAAVWLWGPPGVGKSRLAAEWLAANAQSIVALDCSTCTSEAELLAALGVALGLDAERDQVRARMREHGRGVLLDNVDPVRRAVESLLDGMFPGVLVTCRSASSSDAHASLRLAPLDAAAAAELFAATARLVSPTVSWDPAALARLLPRLDGLPLAIEFAAHRVRVLTVEQQLARLESGAASMAGGVFDWMWNELSPAGRALVVQCCAFVGGFSAPELEATAQLGPRVDVFDVLDELLTSSWLQRTQQGASYRFHLLNAPRDFVASVVAPAELTAAYERALAYWASIAPARRVDVERRAGREALAWFEVERESLLRVVEVGLGHRDARALAVLESLRWNACLVGPTSRYADLVERGRVVATSYGDAPAARFLDFAAEFARVNGYGQDAERDARAAVERARGAGDEALVVQTSVTLAGIESGPAARTIGVLGDALQHAERLGLHLCRVAALERLGRLHRDPDAAEDCFRDALDTLRAYSCDLFAPSCLIGQGQASLAAGRAPDASAHLGAALGVAADAGLAMPVAECQYQLAVAQQTCGELDDAATRIDQALSAWSALGSEGNLARGFVAAARIWWDLDEPARAAWAAQNARRIAAAVRDRNQEALAAGLMVMFHWSDGHNTAEADLLAGIPTLQAADPVAAVAHLTALVGMRAYRGSSAQRELARAATLAATIAEGPSRQAAEQLLAVARAFGHLCDAGRISGPRDGSGARALAERELDGTGVPSQALLDSGTDFYVRLLLAQARRLMERFDAAPMALPAEFRHDVEFHANCHWVRIDGGEPIDLSSRKQLRVIVKALARQYFIDAAVLLSVEELLEVGWPGEAMTPTSGRSRIYTAIRDLRKLGLDALIITEEGGYRLATDVRFRVAAPTGILAQY